MYKHCLSTQNIIDQFHNLASIYLVWLFVMRLKRVEVQVVLDERETTVGIHRKLNFITLFDKCFFISHFIFVLSILVQDVYYCKV